MLCFSSLSLPLFMEIYWENVRDILAIKPILRFQLHISGEFSKKRGVEKVL